MIPSTQPISPLRQRMLDDMRMRKLEPKTQAAYVLAVRYLAGFLGRSPDTATAEDLRRFQLHMTDQGDSPIVCVRPTHIAGLLISGDSVRDELMHTIASEPHTPQIPKRRFYSPELKLQVVGACAQPGASIAGLATQHGINANIVRRWLREHSQGKLVNRPHTFVPVTFNSATKPAAVQPTADIRIEVKRANATIVVHWPLAGGAACAQWLRGCLQ